MRQRNRRQDVNDKNMERFESEILQVDVREASRIDMHWITSGENDPKRNHTENRDWGCCQKVRVGHVTVISALYFCPLRTRLLPNKAVEQTETDIYNRTTDSNQRVTLFSKVCQIILIASVLGRNNFLPVTYIFIMMSSYVRLHIPLKWKITGIIQNIVFGFLYRFVVNTQRMQQFYSWLKTWLLPYICAHNSVIRNAGRPSPDVGLTANS